jgi:TetR/AcrR family transcriptional repressor of bet genes
MMARPSNTDERRLQIVEGLLALLPRTGYDGASVQAIAESAGLTPGLVHYHFDNKLEILVELCGLLEQRLAARFQARAAAGAAPWTRLNAFIDAHLALGDDADPRAVACWVAIGAEALRQPAVRRVYAAVVQAGLETLEGLVAEVLAAEGRRRRNARTIAAGLMAAIHGCYELAITVKATPQGFAAPTLRRMAKGLILSEEEV